jgi:hypothetical protein
MAETDALVFRVSLEPNMYRDIEVAGRATLYALAEAIVTSFDFDFDHAFGFYSKLTGGFLNSPRRYELFADMGEAEAGSKGVKRTPVTEAFPKVGAKMLFLFDYGDEWLFAVELVERRPRQAKVKLPRVVASIGEAPEQYPQFDEDDEEEEA